MSDTPKTALPDSIERMIDELVADITPRYTTVGRFLRTVDGMRTIARAVLASQPSPLASDEVLNLRAWKESAMRSIAKWHALGDELLKRYPLACGDDIPLDLLELVRGSAPLAGEQETWKCAARKAPTDPPQDCDWPFCGCDPCATKVVETLQESGHLVSKRETAQQPISVPKCKQPPEGWACTRPAHHDGPCAAIPTFQVTGEQDTATCQWAQDDAGGDSMWETQCGNNFYFDNDGSPLQHELKYCGFCGKRLVESRTSKEQIK